MAKFKTGLQKKISAIFEGVPIPRNDDAEQLPAASEGKNPDTVSVEMPATEQLSSFISPPQQAAGPLPEATHSKQPAITDTAAKDSRQSQWCQCWKQIENKLFAPKAGVDVGRQKKMAMIMSVLFIIFIFVVVRVFKQSSPTTAIAQSARATNTDNPVAGAESKINWQIPEPYPTKLRDPMQANLTATYQEENGNAGNIIIKGIVYSEDHPAAVIDSRIVHQGDKISGTTVIKINENNIEFEMDGKKWTQEVQR